MSGTYYYYYYQDGKTALDIALEWDFIDAVKVFFDAGIRDYGNEKVSMNYMQLFFVGV